MSRSRSSLFGIAMVLISAVSFGWMAIFARFAYAAGASVTFVLTVRFVAAAAVLWLIVLAGRSARPLDRQRVGGLVFMGLLYVGQAFGYFAALQFLPASTTALILYTYPALVTVLALLFLGDRLDARKAVALVAALSGLALVLGAPAHGLDPRGLALAGANALIYSIYIVSGARITAGLPSVFASACILGVAALAYAGYAVASGSGADFIVPLQAWLAAAGVALISTVVAVTTFLVGLARIGPSRTAILSTLEPVVTVVLAALFLSETLTPVQYAGGALVLAAVLLLARRPGRAPAPRTSKARA